MIRVGMGQQDIVDRGGIEGRRGTFTGLAPFHGQTVVDEYF